MYPIKFHSTDSANIRTSSQVLECKRFAKRLLHTPTENYLYDLRMFINPLRYKICTLYQKHIFSSSSCIHMF
jgi:hypothetical protein